MSADIRPLDAVLEDRPSTIARDLNLNLKRLAEDGALTPGEAALAILACATSVEHGRLAAHARENLAILGFTPEQIQEAAESAAIMGMLNTYYRFRHMVETPQNAEDYKTAGLRMTSLAKPALGKAPFEMLAFAVSVLNGCHDCVKSHEAALRQHGVEVAKIHDLARMASVIKGLKALSIA